MKAEVTTRFFGAEDGNVYPRWFKEGEVISGDLAASEIQAGRAVPLDGAKKPPRHMADAPPSVSQPARASRKRTAKKSEKAD